MSQLQLHKPERSGEVYHYVILIIIASIVLFVGMFLYAGLVGAETEDYTSFTEVDPGGKISVTSDVISFAGLDTNETAYVYNDEGVDFFSGDFTHLVDFNIQTTSQYSVVGIWALSNELRGITYWYNNNIDSIVVFWYGPGILYLREKDGASVYNDTATSLSEDTTYYLKIKRDEDVGTYGTIYCHIYSDEARTILIDTLSIELHSSKKDYRYIFGMVGDDGSGSGQPVTGSIGGLDLGLPAEPGEPSQSTSTIKNNAWFSYFYFNEDIINVLIPLILLFLSIVIIPLDFIADR